MLSLPVNLFGLVKQDSFTSLEMSLLLLNRWPTRTGQNGEYFYWVFDFFVCDYRSSCFLISCRYEAASWSPWFTFSQSWNREIVFEQLSSDAVAGLFEDTHILDRSFFLSIPFRRIGELMFFSRRRPSYLGWFIFSICLWRTKHFPQVGHWKGLSFPQFHRCISMAVS